MTNQEWADKTAEEIVSVLEVEHIEVTEVRGAVITANGVQLLSEALLRASHRVPELKTEVATRDVTCQIIANAAFGRSCG